jgi:arsenate reductase-like glutaredoxin family protein
MSQVTIPHNPACGTSRNVLALIRHAGIEPNDTDLSELVGFEGRRKSRFPS